MRTPAPYATLGAKDAVEFLNTLSPVVGLGAKLPHRSLIYRGQQNSSWPLMPKSRRQGEWPPPITLDPRDTWKNRLIAEANTLFSFCRIADRHGLLVPNWTGLRGELMEFIGEVRHSHLHAVEMWPPQAAAPALALAQRYGLPTCLLDFTGDPYVAAYLAAIGCMEGSAAPMTGDLCVWIIEDFHLTVTRDSPMRDIHLVVPPASDNRTLQAQDGLLMWLPLTTSPVPDLEAVYIQLEGFEHALAGPDANVTKLTLPKREAPSLFHKLIKLGYDASRLFPTFEGAARAVKEHGSARIGRSWS